MSKRELEKIGFASIGCWELSPKGISYNLSDMQEASPALYAFIISDQIRYVGKTARKLKERLSGYANPGISQRTNIRVGKHILDALRAGDLVEIMGFVSLEPQFLGRFVLDIPAALEDSIISELSPSWNGGRQVTAKPMQDKNKGIEAANNVGQSSLDKPVQLKSENTTASLRPCFKVLVGKTYYSKGFFNVGVDHERFMGKDKTPIEIRCGNQQESILGRIDRSANSNGTPRIHVGARLAQWFQKNVKLDQYVKITVLNPNEILIDAL